jgi:hypothetical protein
VRPLRSRRPQGGGKKTGLLPPVQFAKTSLARSRSFQPNLVSAFRRLARRQIIEGPLAVNPFMTT